MGRFSPNETGLSGFARIEADPAKSGTSGSGRSRGGPGGGLEGRHLSALCEDSAVGAQDPRHGGALGPRRRSAQPAGRTCGAFRSLGSGRRGGRGGGPALQYVVRGLSHRRPALTASHSASRGQEAGRGPETLPPPYCGTDGPPRP